MTTTPQQPTRQLIKDNRLPHVGIFPNSCPPFWNSLTHAGKGFPDYYINASFVDRRRYILSQCPTLDTLDDFVGMLLTNRVEHVVVLCNPATEPEALAWWQPQHYTGRPYSLRLHQSSQDGTRIVCRVDNTRNLVDDVWQFTLHLFPRWTDCGSVLPDAQQLMQLVRRVPFPNSKSPVLVHCLMGLNRSGAFTALHHFLSCGDYTPADRDRLNQDVCQFVDCCRRGERNAFLSYQPYLNMVADLLADHYRVTLTPKDEEPQ